MYNIIVLFFTCNMDILVQNSQFAYLSKALYFIILSVRNILSYNYNHNSISGSLNMSCRFQAHRNVLVNFERSLF